MGRRSANAVTAAAGFLVWEMVKIGVAVAMLLLAPRIVQPLSWPALLVGLVVCIKVNWLALAWRGR
jgi:ATP synthase protein I